MNAIPKRRKYADAPITELISTALNDDVLIAGHTLSRCLLIFKIAQQILGRILVEAVFLNELGKCRRARHGEQLTSHLADRFTKLRRTARLVSMPERHFAGFTWSR